MSLALNYMSTHQLLTLAVNTYRSTCRCRSFQMDGAYRRKERMKRAERAPEEGDGEEHRQPLADGGSRTNTAQSEEEELGGCKPQVKRDSSVDGNKPNMSGGTAGSLREALQVFLLALEQILDDIRCVVCKEFKSDWYFVQSFYNLFGRTHFKKLF
ncbi:hypothetical protein MATL_G00211350 [Megalops atlanticus]|uniref:Uncharacterized protein n=1 Tax=Megalops atlanticus TaxID=7932 RepID=A0A9D3PHL3_MEGAT|nr:hypothetical protein MATL_G00211350 [Megalops atlanticus]